MAVSKMNLIRQIQEIVCDFCDTKINPLHVVRLSLWDGMAEIPNGFTLVTFLEEIVIL